MSVALAGCDGRLREDAEPSVKQKNLPPVKIWWVKSNDVAPFLTPMERRGGSHVAELQQ
jgi:hypothetical protein